MSSVYKSGSNGINTTFWIQNKRVHHQNKFYVYSKGQFSGNDLCNSNDKNPIVVTNCIAYVLHVSVRVVLCRQGATAMWSEWTRSGDSPLWLIQTREWQAAAIVFESFLASFAFLLCVALWSVTPSSHFPPRIRVQGLALRHPWYVARKPNAS